MIANLVHEGPKRTIYALAVTGRQSEYQEFVDSLPERVKAKVHARIEYLSAADLPITNTEFSEKLSGDIFELKASLGGLFVRVLYFFYRGDVVITHAFKKKTNKTPGREVRRAEESRKRFLKN